MNLLGGVTVLDLGQIVAGPCAAYYLACLGADVIRVERPGGDVGWKVPPFLGPGGPVSHRADDAISLGHLKRSRGKRSIELDLGNHHGRETLLRLAEQADVLIENGRPGTLDSLGLGYDDVRTRNPQIVYCSISGFGRTGARASRPALDPIVQAESGLMARCGPTDGAPYKAGATIGDQTPAAFAALTVLAALRDRDRTGEGHHIDVAMTDVLMSMVWDDPIDEYVARGLPVRSGNEDPRGAPFGVFETADGWATVVVTSEPQWQRFLEVMGRPELADRWPSAADRVRDRSEVNAEVGRWMRGEEAEQVVDALVAVGVPAGVVRHPGELPRLPDVEERRLFEPLVHPSAGDSTSPWVGARFPVAVDGVLPGAAPTATLGADTDSVMRDAGFTDAEIAGLGHLGAFGETDTSESGP